ncbi:MAG: FecR domain-containing protein [Thiobacillus sp.]|nr:FecR domain-containing protein [Thiobacillus sp.]
MPRASVASWSLLALLVAHPTWASPADADPETPEWRYTVRPGDTLIGVSARYLAEPGGWPRLQKHNSIAKPRRLVPGSALRIPLTWLRHEPAPASVVAVTGQVRVSLAGADERALALGEQLTSGAVLSTAANSGATLRFADGSVMRLQPNARVSLDSVSVYAGGGMVDTRVRLQQGRVEMGANPDRLPGNRLRVITPSAVAAVRGTRFRVSADAAVTRQETLDGEVALTASGQGVSVPAGRGTLAELGQPPRPPVALLPAPDLTNLPGRIDSLPMRFSVPGMPGAVSWLGQIAADGQFDQLLLESTGTMPALSFADLPDGRYWLRVRAADQHGLQGRDAMHAFELDARPFAPLLNAPGTRVRSGQPDMQWSGVVGARDYRLQIARDSTFADRVVDQTTANTQLKLESALAPGRYYWRVASVDESGQGPFSPSWQFDHDPLPGAPDLSESAPVFSDGSLTLAMPPPPSGLQYELVLSRDPGRQQVVWAGRSPDGAARMSPVKAEKYYLSARLVEADGTAGPYATRIIEAPPTPFPWQYLLLLPLLAL